MRIVQVVATLEIGGLERLAVDLAHDQIRAGHRSSIYCVLGRGPLAEEAEDLGIPVVCFDKVRGLSPKTVWGMAEALRRERPQVIHTHNALIHHYGVAAAKLARVPVIVNTRHGLGTMTPSATTERIFRSVLGLTDRVVMVSADSRDNYIRGYGLAPEKTCVIHNGIPLEKFAANRARPGSRQPVVRFGIAARLAEVKDHATLIRAFALVVARMPDAELQILGDGPTRPQLESLVRSLDLSNKVRFAGARTDTAAFFRELDVFVLSSLNEGLPLVILEAMAAGLPIVSTRVGGTPEVAPEGQVAWYCPPSSPAALAETMLAVGGQPDLWKLGDLAHALASQQFSIRTMAFKYEHLFTSLLKRAQGVA